MILIKNGHVVCPVTGTDDVMDVLIDGSRTIQVEKDIKSGEGTWLADKDVAVIDAAGLIVAPGLVDTHVHFRDPGFTEKETLHPGALSAAAGGYTSVVMMANTVPALDEAGIIKDVLQRASKEDIRIYTCANVTKSMNGKELCDYGALLDAGAVGFTDDGNMMDWQKGYVIEARKAGVLQGYPDGSFHGERTATRAEAVTMVQNALDYMEKGIDKDITVKVIHHNYSGDWEQNVPEAMVQNIDGVLYIPADRCHAGLM